MSIPGLILVLLQYLHLAGQDCPAPPGSVLQMTSFGHRLWAVTEDQSLWRSNVGRVNKWERVEGRVRGPLVATQSHLWCATWMTDDIVCVQSSGVVKRIPLSVNTPGVFRNERRGVNRMMVISATESLISIGTYGQLLLRFQVGRQRWSSLTLTDDPIGLHQLGGRLYVIFAQGVHQYHSDKTNEPIKPIASWTLAEGRIISSALSRHGMFCLIQGVDDIWFVHLGADLRLLAEGPRLKKIIPRHKSWFGRESIVYVGEPLRALCAISDDYGRLEILEYRVREREWKRMLTNRSLGDPTAACTHDGRLFVSGNSVVFSFRLKTGSPSRGVSKVKSKSSLPVTRLKDVSKNRGC